MSDRVTAIFLRAVNVSGRTVRPKDLAAQLGLVNIGAAGTFLTKEDPENVIRSLAYAIPFDVDVFAIPLQELAELVAEQPFGPHPAEDGVKRYVTILPEAPASPFGHPRRIPDWDRWEVNVIALRGRFALSLHRRQGPRLRYYPNQVIEKALGVSATTRNWNTIQTILKKARDSS